MAADRGDADPLPRDNPPHSDLIAMLARLLDVMAEDQAHHTGPCDGTFAADCEICREVENARFLIDHDPIGGSSEDYG